MSRYGAAIRDLLSALSGADAQRDGPRMSALQAQLGEFLRAHGIPDCGAVHLYGRETMDRTSPFIGHAWLMETGLAVAMRVADASDTGDVVVRCGHPHTAKPPEELRRVWRESSGRLAMEASNRVWHLRLDGSVDEVSPAVADPTELETMAEVHEPEQGFSTVDTDPTVGIAASRRPVGATSEGGGALGLLTQLSALADMSASIPEPLDEVMSTVASTPGLWEHVLIEHPELRGHQLDALLATLGSLVASLRSSGVTDQPAEPDMRDRARTTVARPSADLPVPTTRPAWRRSDS